MSSTPTGTAPTGNTKPSLTGARIKQRKGVAKSQAKFEPEVFRDELYKHLESVPSGDWEGYAASLDKAGNTLEYRKYGDQLFELLILGGLLAPGGTFNEDGEAPSPFCVFGAKSDKLEDVKPYIDVIEKMIRRYKFLQKPLEESTLQGILQYINRYEVEQRNKLAIAVALMIQAGLATAGVLSSLQKDHLAKDDLAINFVTLVFRTYLVGQTIDHLGSNLRKGGVKEWQLFFPQTKRSQPDLITSYFKSPEVNLPQVADYWVRRQQKEVKDRTIARLGELVQEEASVSETIDYLKAQMKEASMQPEDFVSLVWEGLMKAVDWGSRSDQIEGLALKEVNKNAPILEPFCPNARAEISLINTIQLFCYTDTRVLKIFPNVLKVLYNRDVISDQAILYWAQKGAKPQGKQHFLKATEPLINFLKEADDEDESDEE
ncbi:ARM repeat-containing protein [Violaceomyces palustris]|uniref:ARM repeat-containing protein n=1 Tax=Violaceomyces palustris TaxID=1673888 RepID=A0ACD0NP79_9BASI|nr:ARM repeat-containing protein [Violaceomyces palustris]